MVGTEQSEEGSWEVVQGVVTASPSDALWGWGQTACAAQLQVLGCVLLGGASRRMHPLRCQLRRRTAA